MRSITQSCLLPATRFANRIGIALTGALVLLVLMSLPVAAQACSPRLCQAPTSRHSLSPGNSSEPALEAPMPFVQASLPTPGESTKARRHRTRSNHCFQEVYRLPSTRLPYISRCPSGGGDGQIHKLQFYPAQAVPALATRHS